MTNEEFYKAFRGEPVLYKGKDIHAFVAGYVEEKYVVLGFYDAKGCILLLNTNVTADREYASYRFAKMKYITVVAQKIDNTDKKDIIEAQSKAFNEGCVLYNTCEGVVKVKLEDIVNQSTQGLLYDLNRDEATVCTIFPPEKVLNELATINVLKYLHRVATDHDFCCGGCVHFQNEDAEGIGVCDVDDKVWHCYNVCGKCKKRE